MLDLSRVLAGPWSTQLLADLGATVIKVEALTGGDDTRKWGPPFLDGPDGERDAAYFTAANRNKQSVCIDFSTDEGADLVRRLAADADVLVENFKLGGLKKYDLHYDAIRAVNPGIVYCSITGFGQTGPYAHRAGYDFLIQGMGGLMSVTGQSEGAPGHEPMKVGVAVCDLFTGMYAGVSILAALSHRDRTGEGQHIECSLFDTQVAMLANQAANHLVGGVTPAPMGNSHPNVVPYQVFAVADGHVIIACGNDQQFQRLCTALDLAEVASDPRFTKNAGRIDHRAELQALMQERLDTMPRETVIAALEAAQVSCGPINTIPDVFADPHTIARGLKVPMERPDGTRIDTVAYPARLHGSPATYRTAPPALGGNTDSVLKERLGLSDAALEHMRGRGVIG